QFTFGDQLSEKGADRAGPRVSVALAVAHADVQDRGGPAVVPCPEASRVEVDVRYEVLGEGREEAYDVEGLVDEQPIDHGEVLGVRTAADEELATPVTRRDDAG